MTTDIICTIGPKSDNSVVMTAMAQAGMTIVRNNFSHCLPAEFTNRLKIVEQIKDKAGCNLKILADLQGPRIRTKQVPSGGIEVAPGQKVVFVTNGGEVKEGEVGVDDPYLHSDIKIGERLLVESGSIESIVKKVDIKNHRITAEIVNHGTIMNNKGLNMPTT